MMTTAKRYDLQVGGQTLRNLLEADVEELFRTGLVNASTPCRVPGSAEWQAVNEYLPLLKYGSSVKEESGWEGGLSHRAGEARSLWMTLWKVAMSCFTVGLLCVGSFTMLPRGANRPKVLRAEPFDGPSGSRTARVPEQRAMEVRRVAYSGSQGARPNDRSARLAAQRIAPAGNVAVPELPNKVEEATIPLRKWTVVQSAHGLFRVKVREDGPSLISVWTDDSDEPRQIEKVKGFEAIGSNKVEIYSLPGAKVYYMDRLTAPVGTCVLRVVPEA